MSLKPLLKFLIILPMLSLLMMGCQAPSQPNAPVMNGWLGANADYHRVKRGETLYAIAWYYGYDYRDLARMNELNWPYVVYEGEQIFFSPHRTSKQIYTAKTVIKSEQNQMIALSQVATSIDKTWLWPTKGSVVKEFSQQGTISKGIEIAGQLRQPIYASLDGQVVYSGHGLVGYGNLIIIKHSDDYLSAYAYNAANLVHEGAIVTRGQKIALMGHLGSIGPRLHFEIREHGKPVNPMLYTSTTLEMDRLKERMG